MARVPVIIGNCEDDATRSTDNDNDCYKQCQAMLCCVSCMRPAGDYVDDFAEEARASKDAAAGCSGVGTVAPSDAQEWARWILTGCSGVGTVGKNRVRCSRVGMTHENVGCSGVGTAFLHTSAAQEWA